jgi:glycerol-3-phosphate acyltransferase PlsY
MNADTGLALLLGYLLGSIPFGLLAARIGGKGDIRDIGSGNIGATNVLRTGSKGLAAVTLLLDIAKGAAAVLIARALFDDPAADRFAATGALLGHLYPVWLKFRGGKGVATFLGILVPLIPEAALVFALLWVGLLLTVRISSVSGMVAAASAPLTAFAMGDRTLAAMLLAFALLIIWRHQENIRRLMAGTEPRVGGAKA